METTASALPLSLFYYCLLILSHESSWATTFAFTVRFPLAELTKVFTDRGKEYY